jgi:KipI family sensor histidine kinase inhibitor
MIQPSFQQVSESAWLVELYHDIDPQAPGELARLSGFLQQLFGPALVSATPSYTTLLLEFSKPEDCSSQRLSNALENWDNESLVTASLNGNQAYGGQLHIIPTLYQANVAPDLELIAKTAQLSVEDVIRLHTSQTYLIHAIGFAPGFAFCAEVDPKIQVPRLSTPRTKVPAGSVAIAGKQTAIYPFESPGGWHILGRAAFELVNYERTPITPFKVGDSVKFESISQAQYLSLGGVL